MKLLNTLLILVLLFVASPLHATDFYVDHDYAGGTRNGQAATPWKSLADTLTNTPWTVINAALASADVTVYFSAREASSDVSDVCCDVTIARTDGSTHRLTLDGMTKWNTNDASPSWLDYSGLPTRDTPKAQLYNELGNGWAMGWGVSGIIPTMDYMTIRGFETTGSRARMRFEGGGSHFIAEYNYVHDVTVGGPGMTFNAGAYAYSKGPTSINPSEVCTLRVTHLSDDVIFRYNHINNTADEGLYFGGNGEDGSGHGFNCAGHTNIQFIGNTIANAGIGVGEGDCFDLKNGNRNITYSGNIVGPCWRNGIPLQGAAVGFQPQTVLVEGNLVHDTNSGGGTGAITLIDTWTTVPSSVTVRNNIIYNGSFTANDGDSNTDGDGAKYDINVYNNTFDQSWMAFKYITRGSAINNIILNTGGTTPLVDTSQIASFTVNYNASRVGTSAGANSIALSSGQVSGLFVDQAGHNYRVASTSSAIYNTGTNSSCAATDYYGVTRPQAVLCDIGATEYDGGIVVCTPDHVTLTSQPSNAYLGASLGTVSLGVYDSSNNLCSSATNSVTLSKNTSATWGTLASSSSLTKAAVSGIATWTDLSVTTTTGAGSIDAAASALTGAISTSFTISSPVSVTPVPGASGLITIAAVSASQLQLTWTLATGGTGALSYQVYRSTTNNISTIANAEFYGTVIKAYTVNLATLRATGLKTTGTTPQYYFNVIVKDSLGVKAIYQSSGAHYGWFGF